MALSTEIDTTAHGQIVDVSLSILHSDMTLGKGINPNILTPDMGKEEG